MEVQLLRISELPRLGISANRTEKRQPRNGRFLRQCVCLSFFSAFFLCLPLFGQTKGHDQKQRKFSRVVEVELERIPFDGRSAFAFLEQICDLGPRVCGSDAMVQQRKMLTEHFESLNAKVHEQSFDIRHPLTGDDVTVANLIVQWHPEMKRRILFCTHYDTRPFADRDRENPRAPMIGANDGGSGTALLCEMGRMMPPLKGKIADGNVGVDFVFFDAEEFLFEERPDAYFVGSTYFARDYINNPPEYHYEYAILLDMIGDAELNLFFEGNSLRDAKQLTRSIFHVARELRVSEFTPRLRHTVRDDHLPLNQIAKIPTCDIIDFDYPRVGGKISYWHTQEDTIDKCSPASLAKVGWVLHEWLTQLK